MTGFSFLRGSSWFAGTKRLPPGEGFSLRKNLKFGKDNTMRKDKRTELWRVVKFVLFSASAGVIQIGLFTALNELCRWSYWPCYLIALVASIVWNFTLNRKFTFQSANNVPKAMAMVLGYYAVFTPLSTILGNWLVESCGWNEYLVTVMNMLLNFVTEYLFDTFVVFRSSMDTNEAAKKKAAQK